MPVKINASRTATFPPAPHGRAVARAGRQREPPYSRPPLFFSKFNHNRHQFLKYFVLLIFSFFSLNAGAQNQYFKAPAESPADTHREPYFSEAVVENEPDTTSNADLAPLETHYEPHNTCHNDFNSKFLLTSNADGQLTAYDVVDRNTLSKKWQQMTVCSREDTFTLKRKVRYYDTTPQSNHQLMLNHNPYTGPNPHQYASPDDSIHLSFQIIGKHMAASFMDEHQHRAAFDRAVREIQRSHNQLAVTGHITTDFFHLRLADGRITYMDDRNPDRHGPNTEIIKMHTKENTQNPTFRDKCGHFLTLGVTRTDKRIEIVDKLTLTEIYSETFSTFKLELVSAGHRQPPLYANGGRDDDEGNNTQNDPRIIRRKMGDLEIVYLLHGSDLYTMRPEVKKSQISDAWLLDHGELRKFAIGHDQKMIDDALPDGSVGLPGSRLPRAPLPVSPPNSDYLYSIAGDDEATTTYNALVKDEPIDQMKAIIMAVVIGLLAGMAITYKLMVMWFARHADSDSAAGQVMQAIPVPDTMKKLGHQMSTVSRSRSTDSGSSVTSPTFDASRDEYHEVRPVSPVTIGKPNVEGDFSQPVPVARRSTSSPEPRTRRSTFKGDAPPLIMELPEGSPQTVRQASEPSGSSADRLRPSYTTQRTRQLSHNSTGEPILEQTHSRFREDWSPQTIIGAGGFGIVFKASNTLTEEVRAVKRIQLPDDDEQYEKFKREARTAARMTHKNIIRYYACWIETTTKGQQAEWDREYYEKLSRTSGEWFPQMVGECDGIDDTAVRQVLGVTEDESELTDDSEAGEERRMFQQLETGSSVGFSFGYQRHQSDTPSLRLPMATSTVSSIDVVFDDSVPDARSRKDSVRTLVHSGTASSTPTDLSSDNSTRSRSLSSFSSQVMIIQTPVEATPRSTKVSSSSTKKFKCQSDSSSSEDEDDSERPRRDEDSSGKESSESSSDCGSSCSSADVSESDEESSSSEEVQSEAKSESYWKNSIGSTSGTDTASVEGSASALQRTDTQASLMKSRRESSHNTPVNFLYLVMEYCSGGSLRTWLDTRSPNHPQKPDQRGWTKAQCFRYFSQMCDAIHYLHSKKCIHRDIKPGNIMFDNHPNEDDTQVKLGDFGLSRTDASEIERTPTVDLQRSMRSNILSPAASGSMGDFLRLPSKVDITKGVGTRIYMAPELLMSPKRDVSLRHLLADKLISKNGSLDGRNYRCTSAVDVYALGLVTIELFTDFSTTMSRLLTLEAAKDVHEGLGKIRKYAAEDRDEREDSIWRFPEIAGIVKDMMRREPRERPTAKKLLDRIKEAKRSAERRVEDGEGSDVASLKNTGRTPTQLRQHSIKASLPSEPGLKRSQSTSLAGASKTTSFFLGDSDS